MCQQHHLNPVDCLISSVLEFLQECLSAGLTPMTFKVYVAAILACHNQIQGMSVGKHVSVPCFVHGARRLRPICRHRVPSWDLSVVLEGFSNAPFEPLESASVKLLTLKVAFLIAITSLKWVGDLQALVSCLLLPGFCPWTGQGDFAP